jgi:hypothetical protein
MTEEPLKVLLVWLSTPGAGLVTIWIVDHGRWAKALAEEPQRWLSLGISGALALLAWGAQMGMLYQPMPTDWRRGLEKAVAILFTAFGISQLGQARMRAMRIRRAKQQLRG